MKSPYLRLLATFLVLVVATALVFWHMADIRGHWHLLPADAATFGGITTFDIDADHHLLADDFLGVGSGIGGQIDLWQRSVWFYPSCFGLEIKYKRVGDSLYVRKRHETATNAPLLGTAYRCTDGCCDPQADFFLNSGLQLDLPVVSGAEFTYDTVDNHAFAIPLVIGRAGMTDSFAVNHAYWDSPFRAEELPLLIEQQEVKLPDAKRHRLNLRLYADRDTPGAVLDSLAAQFRAVRPGRSVLRVYRAGSLERPLHLLERELD